MKRLMLISASLMITVGSFAQTGQVDNSFFKFDNAGSPKEVYTLGTAPEFPFLRHMSTSRQVYAAIKRNDENNTPGMDQLNNLLMDIGFSNGVKDLSASDISASYITPGTEGNMGSKGYTMGYYKLEGDASEFKAWKITGNSGYVYLMAKCGNAFFPKTAAHSTACVTAPVNLTGDMSQTTLTDSGQKITTTDNIYVYYHRRRHKRHEAANANSDIPDAYPSAPLLLRSTNDIEVMPVAYNISVSAPDSMVSVCPDSTLNLTANINIEKTSSYAGYYPNSNKKEYKEVSKRKYKRIARNLRREERKERKIARLSGVKANVYS